MQQAWGPVGAPNFLSCGPYGAFIIFFKQIENSEMGGLLEYYPLLGLYDYFGLKELEGKKRGDLGGFSFLCLNTYFGGEGFGSVLLACF